MNPNVTSTNALRALAMLAVLAVCFFVVNLSQVYAQGIPPPPPPPPPGGIGSSSGSGSGSCSAPVVTPAGAKSVAVNAAFTHTIQTTGGTPTSFSYSGLPTGLSANNAVAAGSVATPGTYQITMTATNSCGSDSETFVLTVTSAAAGTSGAPTTGGSTTGGGVTLNQLPATGPEISFETGTMLLYVFIITMVAGASLLVLWPRLTKVHARSSRRD